MKVKKRTSVIVALLCAIAWCCSHCHFKRTQHETIIILDDSTNVNKDTVHIAATNSENTPAYYQSEEVFQYEDIEIVPLETADSGLISYINKNVFTEKYILIQQQDQGVLVFDKNTGAFIRTIGKKGQGPEEFIFFDTFFYDPEGQRVTIIDHMRKAFLIYDITNGAFIGKKEIPFSHDDITYDAAIIDKRKLLLYYRLTGGLIERKNMPAYRLFQTDSMKVLQEKCYDPIRITGFVDNFSWYPISRSSDGVHFIMPLCDTIYRCTPETFVPAYVIEHEQKLVPLEKVVLNDHYGFDAARYRYGKQGYFTGFDKCFETQEGLLLNYLYEGVFTGFIADKKQKKGSYFIYSYTSAKIIRTAQDIPFFAITGCFDDYYVGYALADHLLSLKIDPDSQDPAVKRLREVIANLKEDDNPVLFYYKVKFKG